MDSKDLNVAVLQTSEVQEKPWGTTQRLLAASGVRVHRITVKKGCHCSVHRHKYQFNMFWVEAGSLKIDIFQVPQIDYERPSVSRIPKVEKSYIVTPGLITTVPPGVWHWFEGLEDSIGLELYFSEAAESDIQRYS
jgi:mannose-6-phosphate isomerase-like protein (cupin superfamily)